MRERRAAQTDKGETDLSGRSDRDRPRPGTYRAVTVRCLRSFSQSYLNIAAPLFLLSHGVSSTGLGVLFSASFIIGAILIAPIGIYADRIGRKPFLMAYTVLMVLWGVVYLVSSDVALLLVTSAVVGIGRGGGGMGAGQAGPFAPAEQALLADLVPSRIRNRIFSINAILALLFAAVGSAAAGLPSLLRWTGNSFLDTDKLLFALTCLLGVVSIIVLVPLREPQRAPRASKRPLQRGSTKIVILQSIAGATNAVGVGFVNSLFVVWVHLRYHVGAAAIGPLFSLSFLASGASIFIANSMAGRIGSVRTIIATRIAAVALTLAMAVSPTYFLAAIFQVLRTVAVSMATPIRQSFTMGLFQSGERASAAGITGVARRLSGAASPPIAGALMDAGSLEVPFYLAAAFQLLSAILYRQFFSRLDTSRPRRLPIEAVVEAPLDE